MTESSNLEKRACNLEFRAHGRKLEGYAAVFGKSANIGGFSETIRSGAFKETLNNNKDILALVDHNTSKLLGRTSSGSLRLAEDTRGLHFELDVPQTQLGQDILAMAERRDLGGMSFGFRPTDEAWPTSETRELIAVDLLEVSIVQAFPAYSQTTITARSRPTGLLTPAQRSRLLEIMK